MTEYITPKVKTIDHRKVVADAGTKDPCSGVAAFLSAFEQARAEGRGIYCPAVALPYGFENDRLKRRGLQMTETCMGDRMLEPLYGATRREIEHAESTGIRVLDTVCPLVERFRRTPALLAEQGFTPVIAGNRDSREVQQALELAPADTVTIESAKDAAALEFKDGYGLCLQPRFTLDLAAPVIIALRRRCDRFSLVDTSCPELRAAYSQARLMALSADVVFILGPLDHPVTAEMAARVKLIEKQAIIVDGVNVPDIELDDKTGHVGLIGSPYSSPEQFEIIGKLLKDKYAGGIFEVKWQPEIPNSNLS